MKKFLGSCLLLLLASCSESDAPSVEAGQMILIADNARKTFSVETSHYFDENDNYVNDYTCTNNLDPLEKVTFVIDPAELGNNAIKELVYFTGEANPSTVYFPDGSFTSSVTEHTDGFLDGTFSGQVHNWNGQDKVLSAQFKLAE